MQQYTETLKSILSALNSQITAEGQKTLVELFKFLSDFDSLAKTTPILETVKIGMFEATAEVHGVSWDEVIEEFQKLKPLSKATSKKSDTSTT